MKVTRAMKGMRAMESAEEQDIAIDIADLVGRAVVSKAGRDKGRLFIIWSVVDELNVTVVDGDLRKIEKPKAKRLRHLTMTEYKSDRIVECLATDAKINNAEVRKIVAGLEILEI